MAFSPKDWEFIAQGNALDQMINRILPGTDERTGSFVAPVLGVALSPLRLTAGLRGSETHAEHRFGNFG